MARRGKGKKVKNDDMAAFMGMMGIPGGTGVGNTDIDEADLEAELLALEGKKPSPRSKNTKVRIMCVEIYRIAGFSASS